MVGQPRWHWVMVLPILPYGCASLSVESYNQPPWFCPCRASLVPRISAEGAARDPRQWKKLAGLVSLSPDEKPTSSPNEMLSAIAQAGGARSIAPAIRART